MCYFGLREGKGRRGRDRRKKGNEGREGEKRKPYRRERKIIYKGRDCKENIQREINKLDGKEKKEMKGNK